MVRFLDTGATIGSAPVGNGVATFNPWWLPTGSHTITASFAGSRDFDPSASSAVSVTVGAPIHHRIAPP